MTLAYAPAGVDADAAPPLIAERLRRMAATQPEQVLYTHLTLSLIHI